jgi:transcriptional antiterminator
MGIILETLQDFNVGEDKFVMFSYSDRVGVTHITDDYITQALAETNTAAMLAEVLATKNITVLSRWDENILEEMREKNLLDEYDRESGFEIFLTETLQREAYEYDLLSITTEKYDHKRGACDIEANIKISVKDVTQLGEKAEALFAGWRLAVHTGGGTLTLDM